jgi:uncharacterized protein (DUF58 family)
MPVITPSRLAILLMATGLPVSLLLAAFFPAAWITVFAGMAAVLTAIALDALLSAEARSLEIEPDGAPLFFVGDGNPLHLVFTRKGRPPAPAMQLRLELNDLIGEEPFRTLPASGEIRFHLHMKRRGEARIDAVWLKWKGPFGLTWKQVRIPLGIVRPVNPDIRTLKSDAIRLINREAEFGMKSQLERGDGSEFDAMREFVQGMDHRAVDWKASARHRTLMAKEFQTERNHNVILAFDTGRLMCEPINGISRLDHAVHASLLLAYASLRGGDRVGVYGFDARPKLMTGLVRGQSAFSRLQSEMARLTYSTLDANYTLGLTRLSAALNRRSLVILFTDFVDTTQAELMIENAARLSRRHLVLFAVFQDEDLQHLIAAEPETADDVTRAVIADRLLNERRTVQKRLQRLGIEVLEAPATSFSSDLLSRYLTLTRQERI